MTYHETFQFQAPATALFEALVDEATLRQWLATNARVDARKGGAYHFWGPDVLWGTSESETQGEVLEFDRPKALAIRWCWKGHEGRVSFEVREAAGGSELAIEHRFETFDPGPDGPGPDIAGCHWRIAAGNLTQVLAGRPASLRPDYTVHARGIPARVELEIDIDAPPERVFRALLDPAQMRVWMNAPAPEADAERQRYSYGWTRGDEATEVGPVRLLELIPDRLLVHDWQWPGEPLGQVRWELTPSSGGTHLRLVHTESVDITHSLGWSDALLGIQRLVAADGG